MLPQSFILFICIRTSSYNLPNHHHHHHHHHQHHHHHHHQHHHHHHHHCHRHHHPYHCIIISSRSPLPSWDIIIPCPSTLGWWLVQNDEELGWVPASHLKPDGCLSEEDLTIETFSVGEGQELHFSPYYITYISMHIVEPRYLKLSRVPRNSSR